MAEEVANLDYCHPGEDYEEAGRMGKPPEKHVVEFAGPLKPNTPSYLLQELHQHIDAYILFMGLDKVTDLREILGAGKGP